MLFVYLFMLLRTNENIYNTDSNHLVIIDLSLHPVYRQHSTCQVHLLFDTASF